MIKLFDNLGFGTQIRKSPFFESTLKWGAKSFSVYNHMYIPRDYGDPEQNFWNLINDAILCDVAVERQVQIKGPDATSFVQMMCPRDLSKMQIGQCKYIVLTNQYGGVINDPILLKLDEECYWFSVADSDVLLWAQGLAANSKYKIEISEPDVSPLQLQGPKSEEIMVKLFGNKILDLKYYWFSHFKLNSIDVIISRTGWSSEFGYEIFLLNHKMGNELYESIMEIGTEFGLKAGHTSTIRRIEGGMLSYHADMNSETNPFEIKLSRLIDIEGNFDFIGKAALKKINSNGVKRKLVGLIIEGKPLECPNTSYWDVMDNKKKIGHITSAVYSPRLKKNISLALVNINYDQLKTKLTIKINDQLRKATVVDTPFYDPKKLLVKNKS